MAGVVILVGSMKHSAENPGFLGEVEGPPMDHSLGNYICKASNGPTDDVLPIKQSYSL